MRACFTVSFYLLVTILFSSLTTFAQKPELVAQIGQVYPINSIAFSPDGKTLASVDPSNVKLWDASTGALLRMFTRDDSGGIAFDPDWKILAIVSVGNTIKLWDVVTGRELHTLKGHSSGITKVAFNPDGKILASLSWDGTIKLWDTVTGTELYTLKGHSDDAGTIGEGAVAFSPDGEILATGVKDGSIKLWEVSNGTELLTLKGHSRQASSITFSPDGKILVSRGGGTIKVWDASTGTELHSFESIGENNYGIALSPDGKLLAGYREDKTIKLWDVLTGAELHTLPFGDAYSIAFSPDGKTLASARRGMVRLWDVSAGTELRTLKAQREWLFSLLFSPDGKTIAAGGIDYTVGGKRESEAVGKLPLKPIEILQQNPAFTGKDYTVKLWDASTGVLLQTLIGSSHAVKSVAFSPDGKILAAGTDYTAIRLWDVSTSTELFTADEGEPGIVGPIAFGLGGKAIARLSQNEFIKLWEVSTGRLLREFPGLMAIIKIAFSPDGKILAIMDYAEEKITLFDVSTGAELRSFDGDSDVKAMAFSPDGKTLVVVESADIIILDVSTGKKLHTFQMYSGDTADSGSVDSAALSPDGKTLATTDKTTTKLWDVLTGRELHTLQVSNATALAFSVDGKTLATGNSNGTVKLWDVSTGRELQTLKGHSDHIYSIAFSPNNKYLATGSEDTTIKIWEISSGKELASILAINQRDWLVITPDGLFDSSPGAWNKIIWRFNNNTFNFAPAEAFFSDYYYPGLLTDIFADKRPAAPSDISQKDRRQPQLKLSLTDIQPNTTLATRDVMVKIDVSQAPAGAQDVRLFRNGSLVKVWHGDVLKGQTSATLEATIPIVAGENRLTAYAFNHDNIKSSDATLTVNGADSLKRPGTAYILAVGINEYANPQYNLKYAVPDAQDFAKEVKRQQAKLGQYERVEVISLDDKEATKANILKSLTDLSAKIQPEDAVIIYFAGHGTAQGNRFYLVPHDLGYAGSRTKLDSAGLQNILAHSISDEELEKAVEGIDAGQMLLVIDACNSGQALEAEEKRRGPMNSKGLAQLAYEKGMYILTAAQSYQAALEASKLGHGYLTYALVEEGLKTAAADTAPKDGQVLLREWLDYATTRVPQIQQEKIDEGKGRQLEQVVSFTNGDEKVDPAKRSLQRPRVFYRREVEPQPLIIARP